MKLLAAITFALAIGLSFTGSIRANSLKNCIAQVVEVDVGNKKTFRTAMRDLIIQKAPEFRELAKINWELQTGLIERRQRELQYLLFTDPERLDVKNTVSKLTNYAWNELDTIRMARVAPEYKTLTARLTRLRKQNDDHPDWPRLRQLMTSNLGKSAAYMELIMKFQQDQEFADTLFKDCRPG